MQPTEFIKQGLLLHGIVLKEADLCHIQHVMNTIHHKQSQLTIESDLNEEVPLVIVDRDVIKYV